MRELRNIFSLRAKRSVKNVKIKLYERFRNNFRSLQVFFFLTLTPRGKQNLLRDIYRKVIWHLQYFALWFADGQTFGRFVILYRRYCGGVIFEL